MYGDPWNTLKSGFALIVCTLIVLAWSDSLAEHLN